MKIYSLLLFIICSISVFGQEKIKINIDNPEPRVGQSVTFSINVEFLTEYFKKELGENIDFTRSTSIFGTQSGDFKRVIIFKEAKKYEIGSFDFEFNGKKHTTNIIDVNVLPELPKENGLWLRMIEFEGEKILILEQLIGNKSNRTENENEGYSHTIGGEKPDGIEFAELKEELAKGIKLKKYSSMSSTLTDEDAELFDIGFSYSMMKYKIKFDENFNENYLISEKDFINLPSVFDIGKFVLKK